MKPRSKMPRQLQYQLLGSVVEFFARAGVPEAQIQEAFEKGLVRSRSFRSKTATKSREAGVQLSGDISAHLLRLWHRDSRFLDEVDCSPKALPLYRGKDNLRSLILRLNPNANPNDVLRTMKAVGLIRRTSNGRYLPTANATVIRKLHPWAIEHAARSVIRLVTTVFRNATQVKDVPLLERYSYVPDLSPEESGAFAEFSRSQGQAYLDVLDDWLEQRRVRKPRPRSKISPRGIPAGVHVITYLGDGVGVRRRAERLRSND